MNVHNVVNNARPEATYESSEDLLRHSPFLAGQIPINSLDDNAAAMTNMLLNRDTLVS